MNPVHNPADECPSNCSVPPYGLPGNGSLWWPDGVAMAATGMTGIVIALQKVGAPDLDYVFLDYEWGLVKSFVDQQCEQARAAMKTDARFQAISTALHGPERGTPPRFEPGMSRTPHRMPLFDLRDVIDSS